MPAARPNPYRDPVPFNRIRLGGRLITAILKSIDGVVVKHNWKKQKSKDSNGAVFSFQGTDPVGGEGGFKLTFSAPNEAMFDDLREVLELIKPVPGQGSTGGTAAPTKGQTFAIGSPAKGDAPAATTPAASSPAGGSSSSTTTSTTATATGGAGTSSTDPGTGKTDTGDKSNPGPRPPTLPIENAILSDWMGVMAVASAEYEAPKPTGSNGWEWTVGFIHDKPPTPAGTGAMAPPKPGGSQYAIGSPAKSDEAKAKADAGAAGT